MSRRPSIAQNQVAHDVIERVVVDLEQGFQRGLEENERVTRDITAEMLAKINELQVKVEQQKRLVDTKEAELASVKLQVNTVRDENRSAKQEVSTLQSKLTALLAEKQSKGTITGRTYSPSIKNPAGLRNFSHFKTNSKSCVTPK